MSQGMPLSSDAVMKMFRCDEFPTDEPLIVRLDFTPGIDGAADPEATVTVTDKTSKSKALLLGSAKYIALPSTVLVRGYISSEVNAGNPRPIIFLTTLDLLQNEQHKKRKAPSEDDNSNNNEPFKVPAARIPGGKAFEFLGHMAHVLSNSALSGNVVEDEISKFLQHHQAIQSLTTTNSTSSSSSSGGGAFHHHQEAVTSFAASQFDRQKASLTSNTGRENAEKAARIASQHQDALKQALKDVDKPLTPQLLCSWHAILCRDLCKHAGVIRPKACNVRVGTTYFRRNTINQDVKQVCASLMTLEKRLLHHKDQNISLGIAAATFASAVYFGLIDTHAFQDGNGRLSRIACNWALRRAGVPFCINLLATPAQRKEYMTATVLTRRNVYLAGRGEFPQEVLVEAYERAGALSPLVKLMVDRLTKAIAECNKLVEEKSSMYEEQTEAKAARKFRERAAQGTCSICFEDSPNIASLCCGKAVHLNCIATWLSTKESCPNCRAEMPSLPQSMKPSASSDNNNNNAVVGDEDNDSTTVEFSSNDNDSDDTTTHMSMDDNDTTTDDVDDDTTSDQSVSNGQQQQQQQQEADQDDTETMDDTTENIEANNSSDHDDTSTTEDTTDDSNDTTSVQGNHQNNLPPPCGYCNNRSARDCTNSACGRCCLLHGHFSCSRHN